MKIIPCRNCARAREADPNSKNTCPQYQFQYGDGRFGIEDVPDMIKSLTEFLRQQEFPDGICNCCGMNSNMCFCPCHLGECKSQWRDEV